MRTRARCAVAVGAGLFVACSALMLARQDRAQEVLARAREAIGGQASLAAVTSLSVKASLRQTVTIIAGNSTSPRVQKMTSGLEIQMLLPDKFRVTRAGPSGSRRAYGMNGTSAFLVMWPAPGAVQGPSLLGRPGGAARLAAANTREFLRYLVTWLLMAPERYAVRFSDGGVTASAGEELDVVEAKGAGDFAARLFFDKKSRLVMVTYQEPPTSTLPATPVAEANIPGAGEPLFKSIERPTPPLPGETRLHLSDYRADDGVMLPHRMTFESGGQPMEWEIKRFRVNPSLDPKRFGPGR